MFVLYLWQSSGFAGRLSVSMNETNTAAPASWAGLAALALALLAARALLAAHVDLLSDEAFFAWQGLQAPFSFAPHPPGTALAARAGMALLGKTELGVRLFSLLFSTLTLIPIYRLARALGGSASAFWATAAVALMPMYFVFGGVATPDSGQLFFWSLALYATYRALERQSLVWWVLAGASVGLGLYVKYVLALYFPALLLCLVWSPLWRRQLRTPGPYAAGLVAALLFLPGPLAGVAEGLGASLRYQLGERHALVFPAAAGVFLYQAIHGVIVSPGLYLAALAAMAAAGRRARRERDGRMIFLFSFSAPIYLFFAVITAVTARTHFREHWDAVVYVPALIAAAVLLPEMRPTGWARAAAGGSLLLALVTYGPWVGELLSGWGSRLANRPAFFVNVLGWREMSEAADRHLRATPTATFFLADSYYGAAEYLFYGRETTRVYALESGLQYKQGVVPVLESTGVAQDFLVRERGRDGILMAEEILAPGEGQSQSATYDVQLHQLCSRVQAMPTTEVWRGGRALKRFRFFACFEFDPAPLDRFLFVYAGPAGVVDSSTVRDGELVVKGWAADSREGAPVARVEVRIDSAAVGTATLGLERPDVARALGRDDFLRSGWRFEMPLASLSPGTHEVTAVATNRLGTSRRLTTPHKVLIPDSPRGAP
jgi:4-amino-4-deoxy-L-arabinose transferase-like glycosyltransferase